MHAMPRHTPRPVHRYLTLSGFGAIFVAVWTLASPAMAGRIVSGSLPTDRAFEDRIVSELGAKDPDAVPLFRDANTARDEGDSARASALYGQVHAKDPWYSHATRRQCGAELELGHRADAVRLCREAKATEESPENEAALALALATGQPGVAALSEAEQLITRAESQRPNDASVLATHASIALTRQNTETFRRSTRHLLEVAPETVPAQLYATVLATMEGREEDALAAATHAHSLGLSGEGYERLLEMIHSSVPWETRALRFLGKAGAAWGSAFLVLLGLGFLLSRSTLRAAARPLPPGTGAHVRGPEAMLRSLYRTILWTCCAYYYVSIPLLVVVVLGACAGLVYAMLALGYVSIKLILIALVLGYGSVVAIGKSLLVRVKDEEPGVRLDLSAHPRFLAAVNEVADRVGTRPVDTVFMTPFTDVAVLDRGSLFSNLRGRSDRCLILGAGVLDGMDRRSFKSILAHEYGHFKNEDTAGGGFALSVRRSLMTMALHLMRQGVATKFNPAWWFVTGFWKLFMRISQGASRLQEVLADRWAALAYGSEPFERGLRHVIERSIRFDAHVQATLNEVLPQRRPLMNLYRHVPATGPEDGELLKKVSAELDAKPSSFDSHPAPADRIAWVRAMAAPGAPEDPEDTLPVWGLFEAPEGLEKSMTDRVRELLLEKRGVVLLAEQPASPGRAVTEESATEAAERVA